MSESAWVIEIGNTSCGCALFCDQRLRSFFRLPSDADAMRQQYEARLRRECAQVELDPRQIAHVIIGSVVPQLTPIVVDLTTSALGIVPVIITPHSNANITIGTKNKAEVGCDIVCNLAEVWHRFPDQASIVVDFGTALTVSIVDKRGTLIGVAIAPGVMTALRSLVTSAAQLTTIPLRIPAKYMGTDTTTALQSGIMHGYSGLVARLIAGFKEESAAPARVIATGGTNGDLHTHIAEIDEYDPHLTVMGLWRLGMLNI